MGVGDDLEVGSLLDLSLEERPVRARALPVPGRGLQERHHAVGILSAATVVVTDRDPGCGRRFHELLRGAQHRRTHRDAERAFRVVRVGIDGDVAARRQAFTLLEVGQHLVVAPAGRAIRRPRVEISGMTTDVRHVVDAGRAAEHLPARDHHAALGETEPRVARIRGVHPVGVGVPLQRRACRRHQLLDRRCTTGFDQRHPARRILGEPRGDDRARGPAAHDDDIEHRDHRFGAYPRPGTGAGGRARSRATTQGRTVDPPSTLMTWPVIHPASSDIRNATAAAMSSGSPSTRRPAEAERELLERGVGVVADRLGEDHARRDAVRRGSPRAPSATTRGA